MDIVTLALANKTAGDDAMLHVLDLYSGRIVSQLSLTELPVYAGEPEAVCIYNGKMYIPTASGSIYELMF